ncbi:MAG: lamin tail domain-containing protein, partial [candidate division Zixibacteria bacterium]|nr:lamin tail domain-containing protein [candidate division Zixibacteria bacterium]
MVKSIGQTFGLLVILILYGSSSTVRSELVVNELMVNEPGRSTSLEWIELYVDSTGVVVLDDYQLLVDDELVTIPRGWRLEPDSYLIICRKLVSSDGSASFETRWGDGSGIWGDTPDEAAMTLPPVASFSLVNT